MSYVFTLNGYRAVEHFIAECAAKRKEILDAGIDTANETVLPTSSDILLPGSILLSRFYTIRRRLLHRCLGK